MKHDELRQNILPYYDGQLDAANATRLESHFQQCSECAGELRQLKELSNILRAQRGQGPVNTEAFVAKVLARLPQETKSAQAGWMRRIAQWWQLPAVAGVAALLFVLSPSYSEAVPSTGSLLCAETTGVTETLCGDETADSAEMERVNWSDL